MSNFTDIKNPTPEGRIGKYPPDRQKPIVLGKIYPFELWNFSRTKIIFDNVNYGAIILETRKEKE